VEIYAQRQNAVVVINDPQFLLREFSARLEFCARSRNSSDDNFIFTQAWGKVG